MIVVVVTHSVIDFSIITIIKISKDINQIPAMSFSLPTMVLPLYQVKRVPPESGDVCTK